MTNLENTRLLAIQCMCHPLSRSIEDIENAGTALIDALNERVMLRSFARRLIDPEDLGHAVTSEVRQLAAAALRGKFESSTFLV